MTLDELASRFFGGGSGPARGPSTLREAVAARLPLMVAAGLVAVTASGCGDAPESGAEGSAAGDEPRVYFEQPEDGAAVSSPVDVVFGSENVEIAAVPDQVDAPREGVVHYHLGYDTECLPPGTVIPQADPWIHFGDGSDRIEMSLEPGERLLTVQAGDDEHRTIEGLCETISVTVQEG